MVVTEIEKAEQAMATAFAALLATREELIKAECEADKQGGFDRRGH